MLHKWMFSFLECAIKMKTMCDSLVLERWDVTSFHLYYQVRLFVVCVTG